MSVDRFIAIAAGAVGQGEDDAAFRALCGPGESEKMQRALAGKSTCALFLRGCLAWSLVACGPGQIGGLSAFDWRGIIPPLVPPRLWAPYVDQRAMGDLIAVCRTMVVPPYAGEKRLMSTWIVPGVIVIIGTGNNLHAYIVERLERDGWPDGSIEVTTIEAGQVDGDGRQCAERKRHEIDPSGIDRILLEQGHASGAWVPSSVGPCPRPVAYVLDPTPLLEAT